MCFRIYPPSLQRAYQSPYTLYPPFQCCCLCQDPTAHSSCSNTTSLENAPQLLCLVFLSFPAPRNTWFVCLRGHFSHPSLFIINKNGEQCRCPTGEWIDKLWYIDTTKYKAAIAVRTTDICKNIDESQKHSK